MTLAYERWQPASYEWYTPPWLFDRLRLAFDLDPCSPLAGPVTPAAAHYTRADDGLAQPWRGRVWCHPPYGNLVPRFIGRLAEHGDGLALVLSRTDTRWFHTAAAQASRLCFVRGRLDLVPGPGARRSRPPAGNVLLAFGDACAAALDAAELGTTMATVRPAPTGGIE